MDATETAYVEGLRNENGSLKERVNQLEEQLEWFRRQIFGQRSERIVKDLDSKQLLIEGLEPVPGPVEKAVKIAEHKRVRKSTGADKITLPEDLPVETTVIDLPEEEKVSADGTPLKKIGEEVSHKLALKPSHFYIKEIIRPKYALPNGEGVQTAPLPDSLLHRCRADETLLAGIVVAKFGDHLPLYRLSEIFSRQGVGISRQLLSQWVIGVATACKPLYDEMHRRVLKAPVLHMDESPIPRQEKGRGKVATSYMWVMQADSYVVLDYRQSRSHSHANDLLKDYQGFLHTDKYQAYVKQAEKEEIIWCPCWAHIRRKFFDAQSGDPTFREEVLEQIGTLFALEKQALTLPPDERLCFRQEKEDPLIDELIEKVKNRLIKGSLLPKSALRQACGYFCSLIPHLKNYMGHPNARLDNNAAERAIRPLAIGRKNWLFVGSPKGGQATAILLSLVQTCRYLKINPQEYLEDLFRRLSSHSAPKIAELLPDRWAKDRT